MEAKLKTMGKGMLIAIAMAALASGAYTQAARKRVNRTAETGLVGIKLYDSGTRIVSLFGSPQEIQPISTPSVSGGGAAGGGPTAGPGGAAGNASGGTRGGPIGGGGGGASRTGTTEYTLPSDGIIGDPFDLGPPSMRQMGVAPEPSAGRPGASGGTRGGPLGGGGSGGNGGGGAAGPSGPGERVTFTRWVYNRGGAKYGFVMDRFMRVVQIEVVGYNDRKARTKRGVVFGSTFATIVKKYGAPDAYEIGGDSLMIRYLRRAKVAFRLNRLGANRPHTVTGILVAAGKD